MSSDSNSAASPTRALMRDTNMRIVFAITMMAMMGVSSLNPVFPKVVEAFRIRPEQVALLVTAFTLPGVIVGPFYGIMADRWGRKRILIPSLFLFGVAGAACGLTRNFNTLIALRFAQGMGAGVLGALGTTIIGDLYTGQDRAQAMGMNAGVLSLTSAAFPALGGMLAQIHWSIPFFLPITAIPVAIWAWRSLTSPNPKSTETLKQYLSGAAKGIASRQVLTLFSIGFFSFLILFGPFISFLPIWIADRHHASPATIGIILTASAVTGAVIAWNSRAFAKSNPARTLGIAFLLYATSLITVVWAPTLWWLLLPAAIFGAAQGLNMPTVQTLIAGRAPLEYRAAFMSVNATVLRLGQTVGPALAALLYIHWGMAGLYRISAGVTMLVALVVLTVGGGLLAGVHTPPARTVGGDGVSR